MDGNIMDLGPLDRANWAQRRSTAEVTGRSLCYSGWWRLFNILAQRKKSLTAGDYGGYPLLS